MFSHEAKRAIVISLSATDGKMIKYALIIINKFWSVYSKTANKKNKSTLNKLHRTLNSIGFIINNNNGL